MKDLKNTNLNKLSLNKETIANLNNDEMNKIKGGEVDGKSRVVCRTSGGSICITASCQGSCLEDEVN